MGFAECIRSQVLGCVQRPGYRTTDLGGRAVSRFASQESVAAKFAFNIKPPELARLQRANGKHDMQACGGRIDALLALR